MSIKTKTIKYLGLLLLVFSMVTLLSACGNTNAAKQNKLTLTYSAAASLQPALTQLYQNYHQKHPDITINFDFAGSGAIREKVLAGAPIDGVFLASASDMAKLQSKIIDESALLGNTLVAIAPNTSKISGNITELVTQAKKIAIGEPTTVPAGKYATETFDSLNITSLATPKLVQASDVTQVLSYVASGNADLGFVYKTDAQTNKNIKIVATIPSAAHKEIVYPLAAVKNNNTAVLKATQQFNEFLKSTASEKTFEAYGFTIK